MVLIAATPGVASRLAPVATGCDVALSLCSAIRKCLRQHYDVIFVDVRLGGNAQRAVDAIEDLLDASDGAAVVVVTRRPTPAEIAEAVRLGAYAYVDADKRGFGELVQEIIATVRAVRPRRTLRLAEGSRSMQ